MNSIPEQIVKLRKKAGLSQKDIADHLGKTVGAICNYEKGRRPIRAEDYLKIKELYKKRFPESQTKQES